METEVRWHLHSFELRSTPFGRIAIHPQASTVKLKAAFRQNTICPEDSKFRITDDHELPIFCSRRGHFSPNSPCPQKPHTPYILYTAFSIEAGTFPIDNSSRICIQLSSGSRDNSSTLIPVHARAALVLPHPLQQE